MAKTITYMATAALGTHFYPQKAQSRVIRAYCMDVNLPFSLPITEQLGFVDILSNQVLKEEIEHLICFSLEQLRQASFAGLTLLKEKIQKGMHLHFALESLQINSLSEFEELKLNQKIGEVIKENKEIISQLQTFRGRETDFITKNHLKSQRNYQGRATESKPTLATIAKGFGFDYWDGSRDTGYGGYRDDGRWRSVAQKMISFYKLGGRPRILDIGCGKGYLLKELKSLLPEADLWGLDISPYALENSAEEVRDQLLLGNATNLPFVDGSFDLVISNMTLHNLILPQLKQALREMNRVSRSNAWLGVESYTTEEQKWNLMRWQLTCECFFTPEEWISIFEDVNYQGDFELIYFD